jgi:hypothetical protein
MITGFNTDVEHDGRIYHVQTEDKGVGNPFIESLIYLGGEILASHRSSYADLMATGPDPGSIAQRLEAQHQRMVMNIRQGRHDPGGMKPFGEGIISDRGLEKVILEYLSTELASEALQIVLDNPLRFESGGRHEVLVRARGDLTSLPVKGVKIGLSLLTPFERPRLLAEGSTDARGVFACAITLPTAERGSAAILLEAVLGQERIELKWVVGEEEKPS